MPRLDFIISAIQAGDPTTARLARSWRSWLTTHASDEAAVVNRNLGLEAHLEDDPYAKFLSDVAGASTFSVPSYERACSGHALSGPASQASPTVLRRLFVRERILRRLAKAHGDDPDDFEDAYLEYLAADESTRRTEWLDKLALGRDVMWGAFDDDNHALDPLAGLRSADAKGLLGLPTAWYPPGEPVVYVAYTPTKTRLVPTVATAGWSKYWVPAPAGTGHGLTRDIRGVADDELASQDPVFGVGEVVHESESARCMVSPCDFEAVPA